MNAFFLKVVQFFRTIISTMCNKKSLKVKLEIDSNHDGKPDITVDVSQEGVTTHPENNS